MNKVYYTKRSTKPLTQYQLLKESVFFLDERGMSRLEGSHCKCNGNGEFVLLPKENKAVIEGGKRYMKCRKCGCWSHL